MIRQSSLITMLFILLSINSCNQKGNTSELHQLKQISQNQEVLDKNKELITRFYQEFFGDKDFTAANRYIADTYIQHNPTVGDGKEALVKAAEVWLRDAPKREINFNLIIAENDLVFVQVISENGGNRQSTMDVFRVTDGKITEHWDAFATFKKAQNSANDHPLF